MDTLKIQRGYNTTDPIPYYEDPEDLAPEIKKIGEGLYVQNIKGNNIYIEINKYYYNNINIKIYTRAGDKGNPDYTDDEDY